jgi:hypothetical protein
MLDKQRNKLMRAAQKKKTSKPVPKSWALPKKVRRGRAKLLSP